MSISQLESKPRKVNIKEDTMPTRRQLKELASRHRIRYIPIYHCTKVKELMAQGLSKAAVCVELDISPSTLIKWLSEHPEFKDHYDQGMAAAEKFWEDMAMKAITGEIDSRGSAKLITFMLERRFRHTYGDNKNYLITSETKYSQLSDKELDERINQRLKELKVRDFTKTHNIIDVTPEEVEGIKEEKGKNEENVKKDE